MVAVGDDVAVEDADRADANPVSTRVRGSGGFVEVGYPALSGLLMLRPFKRRGGRLYTQAGLAQTPPIDQTWQSMPPLRDGELRKFMTDSRVGHIENQTAAGDYHGGIQ